MCSRTGRELASAYAVGGIDNDADDRPDKKPDPSHPRQEIHQSQAGKDTQHGDDRHEGHAKWPGMIRVGIPKHDDPDTDEDEGKERSDVCHVGRLADWN